MSATRLGLVVAGLAGLTLWVGLGRAGRLTYHEAIVAQAAREMLASGDVVTPTVGGTPWLEKPPLAMWMVALTGRLAGGVDEVAARAPSAAAATLLSLGVALLAARRFGPPVGLLAGLVQATTAWTVIRGRLADVDVTLACLVTWTLVAFDRLRAPAPAPGPGPDDPAVPSDSPTPADPRPWRWAFFVGLGLTGLAKGVGFGAALVLTAVGLTIAWDRDRAALRRLRFGRGWMLAGLLGLTWPVLAALRHPGAVRLWALHVSDRLSARPEHFTGQPWWEYAPNLLMMLLPWTPLALAGACRSLARACARGARGGGDRLLLAWAAGPLALLSLATVKNPHYAIHALPPCSVWAAQGLVRLGARLQTSRGWPAARVRRLTWAGFLLLGAAYAGGFAALGPRFDRRGVEWAFYEEAARRLRPGEPVALLYHVPEWDRLPYTTPFGPVPHDWAVRLFYLGPGHPAACRFATDELTRSPIGPGPDFAVIGRESDLPALRALGRVETLALGPPVRFDRTYRLYRVTPGADPAPLPVAAHEGDVRR
jgi:4-amino-4-deoxy-L-arabinose transferase-like glycosyltransferase